MDHAEYLSKHYYNDTSPERVAKMRILLSLPGVHTFGQPKYGCVSAYILLSDFGIELIEQIRDLKCVTTPFMLSLLNHPGDNAFVFMVVADGFRSMRRDLAWGMRSHNPKSICWLDEDNMIIQKYTIRSRRLVSHGG